MKRIFCTVFLTILVALFISACGSTEEESNANVTSSESKNVHIYETTNMQEYFNYLSSIDRTKYEILGTSTSEENYNYTSEFYMITYRNINAPRAQSKGNKYDISTANGYYLFCTEEKMTYLDFIDELDFEKYKIQGTSTSMTISNKSHEFYMITYYEL